MLQAEPAAHVILWRGGVDRLGTGVPGTRSGGPTVTPLALAER